MPLFKEIQEYNKISLEIKYILENQTTLDEKQDELLQNPFENNRNEKIKILIMKKTNEFESFIDHLQSNWDNHIRLSEK